MNKRTIHIKKLVLTVDVIGTKENGSPRYEIGVWVAKTELEDQHNIDLFDLKRILVSESEAVLGLVFEYFDDAGAKKDIVVTRKIQPIQVQQLKKTPVVVAMLAENDGTLVKGITTDIVFKR